MKTKWSSLGYFQKSLLIGIILSTLCLIITAITASNLITDAGSLAVIILAVAFIIGLILHKVEPKNLKWSNLNYLQKSLLIGIILSALYLIISMVSIANSTGMIISCPYESFTKCFVSSTSLAIFLGFPFIIAISATSFIVGLILHKIKS